MRVLLVSQNFPPDGLGGVERYTQSLAAHLVAHGDDVAVLARRSERGNKSVQLLRERLPDGATLFRIVTGEFRFEHFLEHHERLDQIFTAAALETSPDVVHVNHLMGLSPRFVQIAHQLGAAVVVSLHDFYFACPRVHLQKPSGDLCHGPDLGHECATTCFTIDPNESRMRWGFRSLYFQQCLRMAERIVCYSEYVRSYFEHVAGKPMQVIPNGIPSGFGDTPGSIPNRRTTLNLAYCGTVARHKGLHLILDALRAARLGSVSLLIIGNVPDSAGREYAGMLRREAANIPELTLRMYGHYEPRDLPVLLQDIDGVIVPSLVPEAGPIVPREVLALGIPVIASRLGALPELIREGVNGFTFDPRRPAELAAILIRFASNEQLRSQMRDGARGSPALTLKEHCDRIRAVYQQAILDFERTSEHSPDLPEFNALQKALLNLGCAPARLHQAFVADQYAEGIKE